MNLWSGVTESLRMAGQALLGNKLRSILSVLGITIGIYCIIAVYALVHSMEKNLNDSFSSMGTDVLFVEKWPWDEIGNNYPWWKYLGRPNTTPEEADFMEKKIRRDMVSAVAFSFRQNVTLKNGDNKLEDVKMTAASHEYNQIQKTDIAEGRYFTFHESVAGRPVAIIGADIASELFPQGAALGSDFKLNGLNTRVIGVCRKEGKSVLDISADKRVFLPFRYAMSVFNFRSGEKGCQIMVKAADGVSLDDLTFEVAQTMRRYRRIKPGDDNTFAVNRMSMITSVVSDLFGQVRNIGLIIGAFSMIVGCFGVANIMFVSVKERTAEIGVQKALGAKKPFILAQFLTESVMLCIAGGIVGLILVAISFVGFNYVLEHVLDSAFKVYLGMGEILLGIWVSVMVGIIAGFLPASSAAAMDPVNAIRSK